MIVLRGATSQSKRSRFESLPIGPAVLSAGADDGEAGQVPPHGIEVRRCVERAQPRFIELDARFEEILLLAPQDDACVEELLPLHARHDADHRVVIRALSVHGWPPREMRAAHAGAASDVSHRRARVASAVGKGAALTSHASGTSATMSSHRGRRDPLGERRIRFAQFACEFQQDVILDGRERIRATGSVRAPAMMEIERRAVVDQPQLAVPHQHVRVARACGRRY